MIPQKLKTSNQRRQWVAKVLNTQINSILTIRQSSYCQARILVLVHGHDQNSKFLVKKGPELIL